MNTTPPASRTARPGHGLRRRHGRVHRLGAYLGRDLWALLGLSGFGLVATFVSIPNENVIYAVGGLVIFGAFTIFDFNRLRQQPRRRRADRSGIFLDIFNVFLLALNLFGGQRE
jgi:FtsH-binding integral membrane protein